MRKRLYEIIEPEDPGRGRPLVSSAYDVMMIVVIVLSILSLAYKEDPPIFTVFEKIAIVIFSIDYLLRWATADYKLREKGIRPFLRYPFTPMAIVDLVSILPAIVWIHEAVKIVRVVRLGRALCVFKTVRYSKTLHMVSSVLKKSRKPLTAVLSLTAGYIVAAALVMFTVEGDSFKDFFEALYWATVSLTTVGYGDITPVTVTGRVVTMISAMVGIAVIALPSSIITASYIEELKRSVEAEEASLETFRASAPETRKKAKKR